MGCFEQLRVCQQPLDHPLSLHIYDPVCALPIPCLYSVCVCAGVCVRTRVRVYVRAECEMSMLLNRCCEAEL